MPITKFRPIDDRAWWWERTFPSHPGMHPQEHTLERVRADAPWVQRVAGEIAALRVAANACLEKARPDMVMRNRWNVVPFVKVNKRTLQSPDTGYPIREPTYYATMRPIVAPPAAAP